VRVTGHRGRAKRRPGDFAGAPRMAPRFPVRRRWTRRSRGQRSRSPILDSASDTAGRQARNPHVSARFIGNGVTPVTVFLVADDAEGRRSESPPHTPHSEQARSVHVMRDGLASSQALGASRSAALSWEDDGTPPSLTQLLAGCLLLVCCWVALPQTALWWDVPLAD
jgi:hypothetical protein